MNFTSRWLKRSEKTRRSNQEIQTTLDTRHRTKKNKADNEKDEQPSNNVEMDQGARERKACCISKTSVVLLIVKSGKNLIVDREKEINIYIMEKIHCHLRNGY